MLVTGNVKPDEYKKLAELVEKIDKDEFSKKFFIVRAMFFPNCFWPFAISKAEYSDAFFPGFPSDRYCNIICLYNLFIGAQH